MKQIKTYVCEQPDFDEKLHDNYINLYACTFFWIYYL